jgi:hypothetical protein
VFQVVECLPGKCEALSPNPNTAKKKKKKSNKKKLQPNKKKPYRSGTWPSLIQRGTLVQTTRLDGDGHGKHRYLQV